MTKDDSDSDKVLVEAVKAFERQASSDDELNKAYDAFERQQQHQHQLGGSVSCRPG